MEVILKNIKNRKMYHEGAEITNIEEFISSIDEGNTIKLVVKKEEVEVRVVPTFIHNNLYTFTYKGAEMTGTLVRKYLDNLSFTMLSPVSGTILNVKISDISNAEVF